MRASFTSSLAKMLRYSLIAPMRAYFRYTETKRGKCALWDYVAERLWQAEGDVTATTREGLRMFVNARDIVGRYIYYFGIWEPNLTAWLEKRLRPGDTFVDVGANVGYYTLLAAHIVGSKGKVVAIEPLPALFDILNHNLLLNEISNVRVVNVAAWDCEDTLPIYTRANHDPSGLTSLIPLWAKHFDLEKVSEIPTRRLSEILRSDEMLSARVIKIDVEGAEWHVLRGLGALLEHCRHDLELMVEVCPRLLHTYGVTARDVLTFFQTKGFHAYQIENDYSAKSYIASGRCSLPMRIENISEEVPLADLIFSHVDAASL